MFYTNLGMSVATKVKSAYEPVIGLETHVQLSTNSKMFCGCGADYRAAPPNSMNCPVCFGMPGALPVVNKMAIEYAMMIGLALGCDIAHTTTFDRKNYNYPDLLKGYQISQMFNPICTNGHLDLDTDPPIRIGINRVHMEEDVAKLIHQDGYALMDANRAGVPLVEIVTEPDFRTPEQVENYISALQSIIRFLGVGRATMEEGSFRCDANVSIRPVGESKFGTKVEVKNMNRISAVGHALRYEIERQIGLLENSEEVQQETRSWEDESQTTMTQRKKESLNDYMYFPEPDLPHIRVSDEWIEAVRSKIPPLPAEHKAQLKKEWGLSAYDAGLLVADVNTLQYFLEAVELASGVVKVQEKQDFAKSVANWVNVEMARLMHDNHITNIYETGIVPQDLARLVHIFKKGELNSNSVKVVINEMFKTKAQPEDIIKSKGLRKVSDVGSLSPVIAKILEANPDPVKDYLAGKEMAVKFLVGQVMKATKGQADALVAEKEIIAQIKKSR